mmetsp:Transcript_1400/g.5294  ORF Transcript_1400/g.5294 Transcript_1400/m.5294 type:complete len:217 (+) Transcript_1400:156-806(+)
MVGSTLSSYKKRSGPCEKERAQWKKFTACECSKHDTLRDGWVIIFDRVYDITVFAVTHPGFDNAGQVSTALAITRNLGKDCTAEFEYTHSLTAWKQLSDFQIGVLTCCGDPNCPECSSLTEAQLTMMRGDDNAEDEVNLAPQKHPLPEWLPSEVVNFWQRYKQGLTDQLARYLEAAGYPQTRPEAAAPAPPPEEREPAKGRSLGWRLRRLAAGGRT